MCPISKEVYLAPATHLQEDIFGEVKDYPSFAQSSRKKYSHEGTKTQRN